MALKSTIFKAELQIADMDRGVYASPQLTLAQHPSENEERLMVRLLAYALNTRGEADQPPLAFARGMTEMDEPDLWRKTYADEIELWIDVGLPDEKWIRKASHRSRETLVYAWGGKTPIWWAQHKGTLSRLPGLQVWQLPAEQVAAMAGLVARSMRLQCTVQDGQIWLGDGEQTVEIQPLRLHPAP